MPKRKPGHIPALTHLKRRGVGRVRLPGRSDILFGPSGVWPANLRRPPRSVEDAYRKVIAEWLAEGGEDAPVPVTAGASIRELAAAYLQHAQKRFQKRGKPTAGYRHARTLAGPLVRLYGDLPAESFGRLESLAVRDALLRTGQRSAATVNTYAKPLRSMFAWGEEKGIVSADAAQRVRTVRWFKPGEAQAGKKKPVPIQDVERTIVYLGKVPAAMVRLLLLTGARPEEVCYMRAGDFHEDEGLLVYEARPDANKMAHRGIGKTIYLGPEAQKVICPFLRNAKRDNPDAWLFRAAVPKRRSAGCIHPGYLDQLIREACARAGVEPWSPGRLRHTRGSQTRRLYGREGAQAELGHLESATTERYTSSILDELARKIARESG